MGAASLIAKLRVDILNVCSLYVRAIALRRQCCSCDLNRPRKKMRVEILQTGIRMRLVRRAEYVAR